jgi:hypothetical protein
MEPPDRPGVKGKNLDHDFDFAELDNGNPLAEGWTMGVPPVIDKMLSYTSDGSVVSLRIGPGAGTHFVAPGVSVEIANHGEEAVVMNIEKAG